MRKFLLTLCALLLAVGTRADETTVTVSTESDSWANHGSWTSYTSDNWGTTWKSTDGNVTVTSTGHTGYIKRSAPAQMATTNYTIESTNIAKVITGYSITFYSATDGTASVISDANSNKVSCSSGSAEDAQTITVTGLSAASTTYTITSAWAVVKEFTITMEDLNETTFTVHVMGSANASAGVMYSETSYYDGDSFVASTDLTASDLTGISVSAENEPTITISSTDIYVVYTPNLTGYYVKNAEAAVTTEAIVEGQWYVLTQLRNGESPAYDAGAGSNIMRASTDVTATTVLTSTNSAEDVKQYLIRFKKNGIGDAYNIQFADGNFWNGVASSATTWTSYLVYTATQTSDSSTGWAINATTDGTTYGNKVDNNGAGSNLSFWGSGQTTSGTNNVWKIYPATVEYDATLYLADMKTAYLAQYTIDNEKLGTLGYPTEAAYNTFRTNVANLDRVATFYDEANNLLTTLLEAVVYPQSYSFYRIKNANTGCYAYAKDPAEAITRINPDNAADHTSNNYLWNVTNTDNTTFAINNIYSESFTKANENSFTTSNTKAVTTLTTDPFGDYPGTFYMEGAHNNNVYKTADNAGYVVSWAFETSEGSHWIFEEVDVTSLKAYGVEITGVGESLDPVVLSDGTVLNAGNASIYWNGTITESNITQREIDGYSIPENAIVIDPVAQMVVITYAPSYEELMTTYMTDNGIAAKLPLAGTLGYPKTTSESYTNLKALVDDLANNYTSAGWANLKSYYTAYVNETDVVLPETNKFYKIMGNATSNYAKSGAANANIPNTTGAATDGTDIWYYNTDNTLINYANGLGTIETREFADVEEIKETSTFQHSTCTAAAAVKFGLFEVISNYSGSKYWYSNTNNVDRNSANNHVNCEWVLTEVTSLPVTISTAKYASFFAPVAVTIPSGVTAYVATDEGDYISLTAIDDAIIPASTGVILYADVDEATTYNFDITTGGTAVSELSGTVATITKPDNAYYFTLGESGLGFYKGGSVATLAAFKPYLLGGGGGVKPFRFNDETAVQALEAAQQAGALYDLSGRRIQRPTKGLFIQNGKKVVIK